MAIKYQKLSQLGDNELSRLLKRSETNISLIKNKVFKLISEIKTEKDEAIISHLKKFDKVEIKPSQLKVNEKEFVQSRKNLPQKVAASIEHACKNIEKFHRSLLPAPIRWCQVQNGVFAGEKITPIESVGLYIPRGKGAFPSVMCMLGVPAKIAQNPKIAVCTPPNKHGKIDDATLYAAQICDIKEIYKVGGASAIAALCYGTQTIPKVKKILGPGNQYCAAAKRLLADEIDCGLPAGPSESIILADEFAKPQKAALDLCIEAEHGPDSAAIFITHSQKLIEKVCQIIPQLIKKLPEKRAGFIKNVFSKKGYGAFLLSDSLEESIKFVNQYAPEHLEILVKEPFITQSKIYNAGEILMGENTPITLGNYLIGVNAILPTGGHGHTHSCTSVESFTKRTSLAYCSKEGYQNLKPAALHLANFEGFPAHANALKERQN